MATSECDVAVIGAGPAGLGAAIELGRLGLQVQVFDRGGIAESIYRYPPGMSFFTSRERIEIGGFPLTIPEVKPTREQALAYYRNVALACSLNLRTYEEVSRIEGSDGDFEVVSLVRGVEQRCRSRKVVVAIGAFARPNLLGVVGEELPKVSHYYGEGHPYAGREVAVIGAGNSAADAALDLFRCGAKVTLVHRGADLSPGLKYWIGPDLRNRIAEGSIRALLGTKVLEIREEVLVVQTAGDTVEVRNDAVFAMTGYGPDPNLLGQLGIPFVEETLAPQFHPQTFETARPGLYVIGALNAGRVSGKIFIENGRHHGLRVARHLREALLPVPGRPPEGPGSVA